MSHGSSIAFTGTTPATGVISTPTTTPPTTTPSATTTARILSRYPIPDELTDPTVDDDAIWIITDDLADPDTLTTVLWPSEY